MYTVYDIFTIDTDTVTTTAYPFCIWLNILHINICIPTSTYVYTYAHIYSVGA